MDVAVIIKTLNEGHNIAATIESAMAALPGRVEIIVADSGSRDDTVEIAGGYPATVVQIEAPASPSCGVGPQLGFQYSSSPLICLIDGDMVLDPEFLPAAMAYLEANPRVAGVSGRVVERNLDNLEFTRRVRRNAPENRVGDTDRLNGGGLYRRTAIEEAGYLSDRNLHSYEEYELGARLRSLGWTLYRLDRPFVTHFGHTINAYRLLLRRWRSKYLQGAGELARASLSQGRWRTLIQELPELRLWGLVYLWWLTLVALLALLPDKAVALMLDLLLVMLVVGLMSVKQKSINLGIYAVVAWCFHAAALPLGFLKLRRVPDAWIESKVLQRAEIHA